MLKKDEAILLNGGCENLLTWENVDQELQTQMEGLKELLKSMSEDGVLSLNDRGWSIVFSASNTTKKFQRTFKYTVLTVLETIIESETSNVLALPNTKESILNAIRMNEKSGLNLTEAADFIKKSLRTTTNERVAIAMNTSAALLLGLNEIRKLAKRLEVA